MICSQWLWKLFMFLFIINLLWPTQNHIIFLKFTLIELFLLASWLHAMHNKTSFFRDEICLTVVFVFFSFELSVDLLDCLDALLMLQRKSRLCFYKTRYCVFCFCFKLLKNFHLNSLALMLCALLPLDPKLTNCCFVICDVYTCDITMCLSILSCTLHASDSNF